MNSFSTLSLSFAVPALLVLLAITAVGIWGLRRKHVYLLSLATGLVCFAAADAGHHIPPAYALLSMVGACCMSQAIAMRFARSANVYVVVVVSVCLLAGVWHGVHVRPLAADALWLQRGVAAAVMLVLLHIYPAVWRSPKRHWAEQALQLNYLAWIAGLACLSLIGFGVGSLSAWVSAGAAVLAALLLVCVWHDASVRVPHSDHRDVLTGLLNRRGLEHAFGDRLHEKAITMVVVCDLDHALPPLRNSSTTVKEGALRQFGELLQSNLREGDWVARLGQQDFALLLRQVSVADVQALLQRIHASLQCQGWANQSPQTRLVASFGVAHVREQDTLTLALHRADVLLCQAKEQGSGSIQVEAQTTRA